MNNYIKKIKIGNVELNNNILLAPLAGITDRPFRVICERFEPGLVCTEMISAKGLYYDDSKTEQLLNMKPISFNKAFTFNRNRFHFSENHNKSSAYKCIVTLNSSIIGVHQYLAFISDTTLSKSGFANTILALIAVYALSH